MIQQQFAEKASQILEPDDNVIGLGIIGSWRSAEMDEFSDLDLILVTRNKVSEQKQDMLRYAGRIGKLLSGFTGDHVGEPRLLICMYDDPLLHVDIKFLTLDEFRTEMKIPFLLLDKEQLLQKVLKDVPAPTAPAVDFQWMEDRFWTWIHYVLQKIGRGEYLEALDTFSALRSIILGPLLQLKNKQLPRGVRKIEKQLPKPELEKLLSTIPLYDKQSLLESLRNVVMLYRELRTALYPKNSCLQEDLEKKVMECLQKMINRNTES